MATSAAVVHQPEGQRQPAPLTFDTPKNAHKSIVRLGSVLAPLLPRGVELEQFASNVFFYMQKNPKLTACTEVSLMEAFQKAAQSGFVLGETCHILSFRNRETGEEEATYCADYKGLAQRMVASGAVRKVDLHVVRKGDEFVYRYGLAPQCDHVVHGDGNRPITHAYVILTLPRNAPPAFLVMSADEIEAIRQKYSRGNKNGPLLGWYAKKTVLRQIAKTIPDPRLLALVRQEEEIEEAVVEPAPMQARIPAETSDNGSPADAPRPGFTAPNVDVDPMREEGAVREYRVSPRAEVEPSTPAGSDTAEYDEPDLEQDDLETKRARLRGQIAEAAKPLHPQVRSSIAMQASKEPDLGALGVILTSTREKAARAQGGE